MRMIAGWMVATVLLLVTGCAEEGGYGGAYGGVYGEYPYTYYGGGPAPVYVYPEYVYPEAGWGPYDRDHYWDRSRHWEQHRWHGDSGWGGRR